MLNVERTVAIVINTVASAKYRPGHILKDSELTTTPITEYIRMIKRTFFQSQRLHQGTH